MIGALGVSPSRWYAKQMKLTRASVLFLVALPSLAFGCWGQLGGYPPMMNVWNAPRPIDDRWEIHRALLATEKLAAEGKILTFYPERFIQPWRRLELKRVNPKYDPAKFDYYISLIRYEGRSEPFTAEVVKVEGTGYNGQLNYTIRHPNYEDTVVLALDGGYGYLGSEALDLLREIH